MSDKKQQIDDNYLADVAGGRGNDAGFGLERGKNLLLEIRQNYAGNAELAAQSMSLSEKLALLRSLAPAQLDAANLAQDDEAAVNELFKSLLAKELL